MHRNITSAVVKIFVLSFVVGVILSVFDIRPETLLADFGDTAVRIFKLVVSAVEWSVPYVLVGAVVVVPVWLVLTLLQAVRSRRK
tara:strand:- start:944 stop:1198 length:255 start_codon:yes stop_codon:yes gene_type:complete